MNGIGGHTGVAVTGGVLGCKSQRAMALAGMLVICMSGSLLLNPVVVFASQAHTDVDAKDQAGMTALDRAVQREDLTSVLALIQAGANVKALDNSGRTPLIWAAQHGSLEIMRALAKAGADLNVKDQQGWTPLADAFQFDHFAVVEALIEAGAEVDRDRMRRDMNTRGSFGRTPLERAAFRGDVSNLRAAIQLGGDINATDSNGRNPLFSGRMEVIGAMTEAGADVNIKDKQGWTPLLLAADMPESGAVQALLKVGADANAVGPNGWNALMRASYLGRLENVRALIPASDVNWRSNGDVTALMLARWACHPAIADTLTQAGALTSPGEWRRAPRLEDFPVSAVYKGHPAAVDFRSNPKAPSYRTRLREGARRGPNFAGHYTAISWGCGSNCQSTTIVDALTGKVYDGFAANRGTDFRLNSNLIVEDPAPPPEAPAYTDDPVATIPVRYYVWEGQRLKLIYEQACTVADHHQSCGCPALQESPG